MKIPNLDRYLEPEEREYHWYACVNCDYETEHMPIYEDIAEPDECPQCQEAGFDEVTDWLQS